MSKTAVVAFSFEQLTDWQRITCGCWRCGVEVPTALEWDDEVFFVYVTLKDWTRVGLCSPACVQAAFEYGLASCFDWQPFNHTGERQAGREYSNGACETCKRKEVTSYITFTKEDGCGGWDFCSATCVRQFFCDEQRRQALTERERRKFIGEEDAYEEYAFTPKTRQTYNKWRK